MQTYEPTLFTPNEAAVLTRLTVKAVNNAIDRKTVPVAGSQRAGRGARLLDLRALMSLALERRLADRFLPELRREVFEALESTPRNTLSLEGGFLKIDLREPRRELANSLRELRRARELVVVDPDIMGGDPVFRGTRIPVHLIASFVEKGAGVDLINDYPRLTPEMIRLASIYAAAYPQQGRPRKQPWNDRPPVYTSRRKLSDFEAA